MSVGAQWNCTVSGDDNISALLFWKLRLPDGVRLADIAAALGVLMRRHESLRTNFLDGDQPAQRVLGSGELLVDVLRATKSDALADELIAGMRAKAIDIATELPIRAAVAVDADDVSVAAALLAAVCTVMSVRTGVERCVFALLSGNRFRQRLHGYVGALAQDCLLSFEIGGDFDEVIRRVGAATLTANTHGQYDIDRLGHVMDTIGHARGIAFNRDFSFNNISDFMGAAGQAIS